MTKLHKVSAPGKIILLGEHAVVYGKPAIIAAVDKRCFVTISSRKDKKIKIVSKNYKRELITDYEKISSKFNKAEQDWKIFDQHNDIELLKSITNEPIDYPQIIIGQFLDYFNLNSVNGFDLVIDSEIPVGSGMGSSAALAVSMLGALFLFKEKKIDKKVINDIAFLCELKRHGKASGIDNSTSCYGGLNYFQKSQGIKPLDLKLTQKIMKNFYIVNSGSPEESSGEMIALVNLLFRKKSMLVEDIFTDQERLTIEFIDALNNGDEKELKRIIIAGEENLEKLGVVSANVEALIKEINRSGGAAKICGAGGRKNGSGVILIYHNNKKVFTTLVKSKKLQLLTITLTDKGVHSIDN